MFIHAVKSAEDFVAPTNQIVDAEVSHAADLVKDRKLEVIDRSFEHH